MQFKETCTLLNMILARNNLFDVWKLLRPVENKLHELVLALYAFVEAIDYNMELIRAGITQDIQEHIA